MNRGSVIPFLPLYFLHNNLTAEVNEVSPAAVVNEMEDSAAPQRKDKSWKAAKNSMAKVEAFLKSFINCKAWDVPETHQGCPV